jgi:heat shock protein HslJ
VIHHRPGRPLLNARILALALAAGVALAACSGGASPSATSSAGPGDGAALEGTPWQLTDYVGPDGGTLAVPEAVAASALFEAGKVSGNAGCNSYTGPYTLDGDTLTIGEVATTAMACPAVPSALEQAFLAALGKVATYAIVGDRLELRTAEGTVGLRFAVAEAPALTGTRWVATMINNGKGAVGSVVEGSTVTAIFAEGGTVAGDGGCNTYNGPYKVDGDAIDIGPLMSTKKACADEAATAQETAYFAALENAATFEFNGDRLQLRAADGALQVEYRPTLP